MAALPEEATQPHQSSAACKKGLWLEAQVRCHGGNESSGAVLWRKEGSALAGSIHPLLRIAKQCPVLTFLFPSASKPVTAVVIGAGQRGTGYSGTSLPSLYAMPGTDLRYQVATRSLSMPDPDRAHRPRTCCAMLCADLASDALRIRARLPAPPQDRRCG
eukprot:257509-Rhodomonas_salina.1